MTVGAACVPVLSAGCLVVSLWLPMALGPFDLLESLRSSCNREGRLAEFGALQAASHVGSMTPLVVFVLRPRAPSCFCPAEGMRWTVGVEHCWQEG